MASQNPSNHIPLADLPPVPWGTHLPNASASPQARLRCAMLDLLTSNTIETATHTPGPYFAHTAPKVCLWTRFYKTTNLPALLQAYGLDSLPNASAIHIITFMITIYKIIPDTEPSANSSYRIRSSMVAYEANDEVVVAATRGDLNAHLTTSIEFVWSKPLEPRGLSPSLGWESIVAILCMVAHCGVSPLNVELLVAGPARRNLGGID